MNSLEDEEKMISKKVAEYELALCFLKENNVEDAVKHLLLAVEPCNEMDRYNWGIIYYKGVGVEKDYAKALKWFELAAEKNYASAERILGWMYCNGEGVEKNEEKAAELFVRAVEHGYEDAATRYMAGQSFLYAISVEQDIDKGVQLLRKAANMERDENCRAAQRLLGELYYEGKLVERDLREAEKWLTIAAKNGSEDAAGLLEKVMSELQNT